MPAQAAAPVHVDGWHAVTLRGEHIAEEFHAIVERYVEQRFGSKVETAVRTA